jgi:hypothetical protein
MTDRPKTGGFPGLKTGMGLFSAWTETLLQQAQAWDDLWGKVRNGTQSTQDFTEAIVGAVERSATLMRQAMLAYGGPAAPPWASLHLREPVEIPVRHTVDTQRKLRVSPFSPLGNARPRSLPFATATPVDSGRIRVELDTDKAKTPEPGEYLALVFSEQYKDPLAIVTLFVEKPPASSSPPSARSLSASSKKKASKKKAPKKKTAT